MLGGDRGWRPAEGPDTGRASLARREGAQRTAHRLALEVERLRREGILSQAGLARVLTLRAVPTPEGGAVWTHTTVARVMAQFGSPRLHRADIG